ncbi:MAG: class I SAM-dependent methyltransferase [Pseudomonadota bacterium]
MDALYQNPRLVEVYDAINQSRADYDFYIGELPEPPAALLDIGCGTGTFALDLANRGYAVTAVDPAPQMVAMAAQKDAGRSVNWVTGSVADLPVDARFDAAVMTGHAFQCLLDDTQISALFKAVEQRLCRDGSFWFETRNRAAKPWLRWRPNCAAPAVALGGGRTVKVTHNVLRVSDGRVTFEERYDFNDHSAVVTSRSTLRFPDLNEIAAFAVRHGLTVAETFGTWTREPLMRDSPEIIVRLQKAA